MIVKLTCKCGQRLRARDDKLGRHGRCPACGRVARVPAVVPEEEEGEPDDEMVLNAEPVEPVPGALRPLDAQNPDVEIVYDPDDGPARILPGRPHATPPAAAIPLEEVEILEPPSYPAQDMPTEEAYPLAKPPAPAPAAPAEPETEPRPRQRKKKRRRRPPPVPLWRRHAYAVFAVALVPLAFAVFHKDEPLVRRVERALRGQSASPDQQNADSNGEETSDRRDRPGRRPVITRGGIDDLLGLLPEGRLPGSLLPRNTWLHWAFAVGSAGAFLGILIVLFPRAIAPAWQLLLIGLFTSTIGILLLLFVQWSSTFLLFHFYIGFGSVFLWILKLIGLSYIAALHPGTPFIYSLLGFTLGVGLCEEVCKALPLIAHFHGRRPWLSWQGACLWGLASGVGFGVAEGVHYSASYYNGIEPANAYVVRFVSCVALHAIWTAAAGIMVYNQQATIQGTMARYEWFVPILIMVAVPMILHGLYDTLLKKDYPAIALVVALASFGWLAFLVEKMRDVAGEEPDPDDLPI